MPTRTQKDKDFILSNLEETYFIENFVTKEDISQLIDSWHQSKNKVYNYLGYIFIIISFFSAYSIRHIDENSLSNFVFVLIICISTDVGDASLIVDKFGWVVPIKSPKILAQKLLNASDEYFVNNKDWENRRVESRSHVKINYPLEKMVENYRAIWDS